MMASIPNPIAAPDRPELPRVRLEVRTGSGRLVAYEVATEEFLIGSASGCDLRLPTPTHTAVICQISRKSDGVKVRRLAQGVQILLNGNALPANTQTSIGHNDQLVIAGVEIAIAILSQGYLSPKLTPIELHQPKLKVAEERIDGDAVRRMEVLDQREARVLERERVLEQRTREIEADRVIWKKEQESQVFDGWRELERARDLLAKDRELFSQARIAFELERDAGIERIDTQGETQAALNANIGEREIALRGERESFERERRQLADDLLRLDRRRAEVEQREELILGRSRELEVRLDQLKRDAAEWEETLSLAAADQDRLRTESERLDRQKAELDSQTARLATRAAELESQQGLLNILRSKLERTREEVEREASALAVARSREDASQSDLRARIQEAESLRAELGTAQASAEQERRRLAEQDALLAAGLQEISQRMAAIAANEVRLTERESELDRRSSEFAEQAGALTGRMKQALDLQSRLEADRIAIRERESALAQSESAQQALQEQLRRRADELHKRSKSFDEQARQLASDRAIFEQSRNSSIEEHSIAMERLAVATSAVEARAGEIERQAQLLVDREGALGRQLLRLKEVGQAVAAERKNLSEARKVVQAERTSAELEVRTARQELESFRARVNLDLETFRAEAPELDERTTSLLTRLGAAKETLRGYLNELNGFAQQSRAEMEVARSQLHAESERLRIQEADLERARGEHRLAVTSFRQQIVDWQSKVAEMKQMLAMGEHRLEERQAAVDEAARNVDATSQQLAEQAESLRRERDEVSQRRIEVESHLADMREWYRKKLRELADARGEIEHLRLAETNEPSASSNSTTSELLEELNPGDRQLGELLRKLDLVDSETLASLWNEAGRQRRSLRQVFLSSGVITLYQLALIEAGNLDALMLGRFRVIDRLRVTPREAIYRVLDPSRVDGKSGGMFLLRHLAESEMQDAVHPDEFRQRFSAARDAAHINLIVPIEVTEVNGRPAVLVEWPNGLASSEWSATAAHPGCWIHLATMAAEGLEAAHLAGLAHGRLTSEAILLTADGIVKLTGFGEPPWLSTIPITAGNQTPEGDLRALGQIFYGWSQLSVRKKGSRSKPFPAELAAVIRRLEADAEPPMGDTLPAEQPYGSVSELVADLKRLAREISFSDDAWEKLLQHVVATTTETGPELRQSA